MQTWKGLLGMLVCLLAVMGNAEVPAQQPEFQVVTGELAPYTFTENGELSGFVVEIVQDVINRVGFPHDILVEPWKRALVNSHARRITFPLIRSADREADYTWIAPLASDGSAFVVRAKDPTNYTSMDDFKGLRIGVLLGARTTTILEELGFTHIEPVSTTEQNVKKLLAGRIDAWFESELMVQFTLKKMGIGDDQVTIAFRRPKAPMYIVASPDIPESVIAAWRSAIDAMKADGTYQKILEKYGIGLEFSLE